MNKEISDLTAAGTLSGTELLLITQGGNSRKLTLADLAQYILTAESIIPESEPWRGARAELTVNNDGLTSNIIFPWDTAPVDTDSFWSAGVPTRLTVGPGISKVRLSWGLKFASMSVAGSVHAKLNRNGSLEPNATYTTPRSGTTGTSENIAVGFSSVLDVDENDYFELNIFFTMSGQDEILTGSWFQIEVVEAQP